jgi:hypothetical protein
MKKMLVFVFSLLPPLLPLFFWSGRADAQIAKEKPLMTKILPDIAGERGRDRNGRSRSGRGRSAAST